jgi:hypothetical protein
MNMHRILSKGAEMTDETYLEQKLEWVKYRLRILDEIEVRLGEMRKISVQARDDKLSVPKRQKLSDRLHALEKEVNQLDRKSKTFWLECQ